MKNINSSERLNGKISVENWYAYRDEAGKIVEEISPIFFFIFFSFFLSPLRQQQSSFSSRVQASPGRFLQTLTRTINRCSRGFL